ncbi:DUF4251 domain-containing protein [Microbacter margulisiae]|uniref:DUF4251 domain-containing protein n=1 Tax=Microbacter margulisiae TaxID=1350067 RepID=A0A7W5DNM3_9PORP|nr:DUF4251 domain-containing protein [Microbacter margulisiae]MBB3186265.1 hypothetical protein [Microbacter margulisiae]
MKTRKIVLAVSMMVAGVLLASPLLARDFPKAQKESIQKEKKAAEKAAREAARMLTFRQALQALNDSTWILEANQVYSKWGRIFEVNDNTNFIMLEKGKAYLQLAFNGFRSGPNGIGGITLKGYPTKITITKDKQGNVTYNMNVMGNGLNADITLWLGYGDNHAEAMVNATFSSGQVSFAGRLVPLSQSNYFKSGLDF